MVHKQLLATLAKHGVEPIAALGQAVRPEPARGVIQQPDAEHPEGTVVAELSKGYRIHDRVLRPDQGRRLDHARSRAIDSRRQRGATTSGQLEVNRCPLTTISATPATTSSRPSSRSRPTRRPSARVPRGQAPPQDRRRGRDPVQGVGLLPDRLPERVVQEGGRGRQASRAAKPATDSSSTASPGADAPRSPNRPRPRPAGTGPLHDPGTLPDLLAARIEIAGSGRPAELPLLLRPLPADRPRPLDRRGLRHPRPGEPDDSTIRRRGDDGRVRRR